MSVRKWFRLFVSAKVTVALLCLLSVLLLINVALPQVEPGFGGMATSPVFVTVLVLFFLNLTLVLASRVVPTWHRIALKPRSVTGLRAWARLEESLSAPLPDGWSVAGVVRTLRGFGYRVRRPGEQTIWAVKHRTAPLWFLLFHISFFLLCAGGVLIYYTRFVGSAVLSEGQEFAGAYSRIERTPPYSGAAPELNFTVQRVEPRFEDGHPVHLGAVLQFDRIGSSVERTSRVNHPAHWGSASLLVTRAGLAPVLWLQDAQGFTVDRVVVPVRTKSGQPTEIGFADDRYHALVHSLDAGAPFPSREELPHAELRVQVMQESRVVFDGMLGPGDAAMLDEVRLVMEEMRYWVEVRVVSERGGGLLIGGFVLGVVGLIWRLLWYRREVALTWDEQGFRLVGRSEFFSSRFALELRQIHSTLCGAAGITGGDRASSASRTGGSRG